MIEPIHIVPVRPFRLQVLGGMVLLPPEQPTDEERERAALLDNRRRVLAVLTVLAVSTRPLSRDQLADFFWSDSDPVRARHSLAEALRLLRRVLGTDIVAPRANELQLASTAPLETDLQAFLAAQQEGRHADAVSLYAADFLDGVHVDRAPRFEEWADRQRDLLREAFTTSCAAAVTRQAHAGQHGAAASIARRWLDVAPLSVDAAEAWLRALVAPGTAEAVRAARERFTQYAAQLHAEFETGPERRLARLLEDAEQALAAKRGSTPVEPSSVASALPAGAEVLVSPARHTELRADAAVSGVAETTTPVPTPSRTPTRTANRRWALVAAAVLVIAFGVWRLIAPPSLFGGSREQRTLVVVADAENATADTLLGNAVTLAMATALNESDAVRTVPNGRVRALRALAVAPTDSGAVRGPLTEALARAVAVRAGAPAVVVPVVVALGPQYRIALRVVGANDGATMATLQSEVVPQASLMSALDAVIREARRRFGGSRAEQRQARPLPEYTTASIEALQLFAAGARAFNSVEYGRALDFYRQATRVDSTFAMAWNAMGKTLLYMNNPQEADSAIRRAEQFIDRLSPRERMMVRATRARAHGQLDSAIAMRGQWLLTHPDDSEMLRQQAFDLLSRNRFGEAVRVAEQFLQRDSTDEIVWTNLALSYPGEDRATRRKAVAAYGRAITLDTMTLRNPMVTQLYGGLLVRAEMYDSAAQFFRRYDAAPAQMRARAYRAMGQMELWRGRLQESIEPFRQAVALSFSAADTISGVRSRLWLASALELLGDSLQATAQFDSLAREVTGQREPLLYYWVGLALARAHRVDAAERVLAAQAARVLPSSRSHLAARDLLATEIAVARRRPAPITPALLAAAQVDSSEITWETLGWAALQQGDTATARRMGDGVLRGRPNFAFEGWLARERVRRWYAGLTVRRDR